MKKFIKFKANNNLITKKLFLLCGLGMLIVLGMCGIGIATPWDINTSVYTNEHFNYNVNVTNGVDFVFNTNGTKMYILDYPAPHNRVVEYNLSQAWNVSTAVAKTTKIIDDNSPLGLAFNSDGTKMYVSGIDSDKIYQYPLTTAWDLSTLGVYEKVHTTTYETTGLAFNSNGTMVYQNDGYNNTRGYSLSTAWNINTSSKYGIYNFSINKPCYSYTLRFNLNGTQMYIACSGSLIMQYNLSIPWNVNTSIYDDSFNSSAQDNDVGASFIGGNGTLNGTNMYTLGGVATTVYQYLLSVSSSPGTPSFTLNSPANGASNQVVSLLLNVSITDSDNTTLLWVAFYNYTNMAIFYNATNVVNNSNVNYTWAVDYNKTYTWFAMAWDGTSGTNVTNSSFWSFTTITPAIRLNWTYPTNNTQYNTLNLTFNITLTNITNISHTCNLYQNGILNTSSYLTTYCYQETANISTSCGGLATGNYTFTAAEWFGTQPVTNTFDENWGTYGTCAPEPGAHNATFIINYSKPINSVAALWRFGYSGIETNFTVPNDCWNAYSNKLHLMVNVESAGGVYYLRTYCDNILGWKELFSQTGGGTSIKRFYEEGIWWDLGGYFTVNYSFSTQSQYNYSINCSNAYYYNSTENRTIYIDNVMPTITSNLINNNTYYFDTTQLPIWTYVTDPFLYSINITDDRTFVNYTNLTGYATYNWTKNISIANYSMGQHNVTTVVCDAHTSQVIDDIPIQENILFKKITFEYPETGGYASVYPENYFGVTAFNTIRLKDRYVFTYDYTFKQDKVTFIVKSDDPIDIVNNEYYKGWLVIPSQKKWIDFELPNSADLIYNIERVDYNVVKITISGFKEPQSKFVFNDHVPTVKEISEVALLEEQEILLEK